MPEAERWGMEKSDRLIRASYRKWSFIIADGNPTGKYKFKLVVFDIETSLRYDVPNWDSMHKDGTNISWPTSVRSRPQTVPCGWFLVVVATVDGVLVVSIMLLG
ncbi:hypothetical protein [Bifidobacterium psychraerophilum]|uniref:Uncharacterized protein n=1 Tax=Bifidobacterium psychraerophilum TaxID=218140 RepID=A0A087CIZ2_9BIFI|nr:hypothetical protein [Bifidobacterium psychraerophilum]KFI83242.1 hypothetical protein BPSY_0338 [Bifidobacterium psychraerophilum]PKA94297.1 hypothetical protein A9A89_0503 [Bifidobacterium psychraerophilum DSM 22366]